jgi:integrase
MRGHIRKRSRASWAIVIDLGRDPGGKRRQKWHTVHGTKQDAERELANLLNSIHKGDYVEPSKMTVSDYLSNWLAEYAKLNVSPKTYERYMDIISKNILPALGEYHLSKLRPLHIQSFYTDALTQGRKDGRGGLSAQTVLHFHRVLRKALQQAVKWQLLARNPTEAVEAPRPQRKEMHAVDETGTARLLHAVEGMRLYMPVLLAVMTGMRRGEILALRWQDTDLEKGKIAVRRSLEQTRDGLRFKQPKTGKGMRSIALPGIAVQTLRRHKIAQAQERLRLGPAYEDNDLVCPRLDGGPWAPDSLSTAFAGLIRRSDLPRVRFHDLRHSHATQLLRHGIHPKVVSERLGHSKVGITLDTYSHVLPGMQEEAASKVDAALRVAMEKYKDN